MKQVIQDKWEMLTALKFQRYIESMHKCCQLVIEARGGSIKYKCYHFIQNPKLYLGNLWFPTKKRLGGGSEI